MISGDKEAVNGDSMRNEGSTSLEGHQQADEQTTSFGPWMVVQRNRRLPTILQRGSSGNKKEATVGNEGGDQAEVMEKQEAVNGDQLRSSQSSAIQIAGSKETAKTPLSMGKDPTQAQTEELVASKQTSSTKGQTKLSSKGSNTMGSRYAVLREANESADLKEATEQVN